MKIIFIEDTNFTRSDLQKGPLQNYNIINYKIKMYINYIVYVKYICEVYVRMLVYKMQVRLRESLWSILVKQTLYFISFCIKECDVNKWAKRCVC